jgi:multiple sugar transport system substrate-binding protein
MVKLNRHNVNKKGVYGMGRLKHHNVSTALVLLVCMVFLFGACSSGQPSQTAVTTTAAAPSTSAEATTAAVDNEYKNDLGMYTLQGELNAAPQAASMSDKKITLTGWMTPMWTVVDEKVTNGKKMTLEEFLNETMKRFASSYSGANIAEVVVENIPGKDRDEKISVAMSAGALPDFIYESFFAVSSRAHDGLFLTLDDIIDDAAKTDMPSSIWNAVKIANSVYCYPFTQGLNFMGYNADMFKQAGLDKYIAGKNELAFWTPDQLTEICTAIKKTVGVDPIVFGCKSANADTWFLKYIRMFGGEWFDQNGMVIANNPTTVKGLEYIVDLKNKGLTNSNPESTEGADSRTQLMNKLCAIGLMGGSNLSSFWADMESGKIESFDLRAAYVPGTEKCVSTYVQGFSAFNTGKNENMRAAKDYIKWVNSNSVLLEESRWMVPVRNSVFEKYIDFNPMFKAYKEASDYAIDFSNNSVSYTELRNTLYPQLQAAFTGMKTPQQTMDDYTAAANKIIEEGMKKSVALKR